MISQANISDVTTDPCGLKKNSRMISALDNSVSQTKLESHANMVCLGWHAIIIEDTGKTVYVKPFTPDYNALQKVPVVTGANLTECAFTGKTRIFIFHNDLSVPEMDHNLVPPLILWEAGLIVNDTPKIHVKDPSVEDHTILFPKYDVWIPLSLNGILSCFPSSKPSIDDMDICEDIFLTTPEGKWNPRTDAYAQNEANMLDYEGNMINNKDLFKIILEEVVLDEALTASMMISEVETQQVDKIMVSVKAKAIQC